MKIQGPGPTKNGKTSKTSRKDSVDGAFGEMIGGTDASSEPSKGTSGITSTAQVDTILSLQETDDSTSAEARAKSKARGDQILDQLDKIRIGLLTGGISRSDLNNLSRGIAAQRERAIDPELIEILDEIDLRAQVELAKHSLD